MKRWQVLSGPPLRDVLHLLFVAGFLGLIGWQFLVEAAPAASGALVYPLSLAAGCGLALAYWRLEPLRFYLTVLSFAPILVLVAFLEFSPAGDLLTSGDGPEPVRGVQAHAPVVLVVLDELPVTSLMDARGRIDARRSPNFARFAGDATWYRNAVTVADHTRFAVPAILTGRGVRSENALPTADDHPNTLFRLLGDRYRLNVVEWLTHLCPRTLCERQLTRSLSQRMRGLLTNSEVLGIPVVPDALSFRLAGWIRPGEESIRRRVDDPGGDANVRRDAYFGQDKRLDLFLSSLDDRRGPTLDFLHLLLPHVPWFRFPGGQAYDAQDSLFAVNPRLWPDDPRFAAIGYQRHLLEVGNVDRALGRVIHRLKQLGDYDRSLIIVTADHGISFRAGESARDASPANVGEVAAVPLLVKAPRQRAGTIDDGTVQSTDVLPTIADALGIEVPWQTDGRPADEVGRSRAAATVHSPSTAGPVTVSRERVELGRNVALTRKLALFGSDPGSLYALGGHSELIGRSTASLPVREPGHIRATIADADRYLSIEPRSPSLPAEITGRIDGGAPDTQRKIAVAVNGRIAATAWTLLLGQTESYAVLCPPSSFRTGSNRVEVFELSEQGSGTALTRISAP